MAKHMECGCWLTDDLSEVEGVCDAHKTWQMAMYASAHDFGETHEREECARLVEGHEEIGEVRLVIAHQIRKRNKMSGRPGSPEVQEMTSAFEAAIRKFVEHRRKHGGILLPDCVIIDGAFDEAMHRTGQRKK